MHPTSRPRRRRLPARVYWFRRALVLSVALGMVFGIAHLLGAGDGSSDVATEPAAQVVGAAPSSSRALGTPVATADAPTGAASERATRNAAGPLKPTKTRTPLAEPSGPCPVDDLVATPTVAGTAVAGSPVTFRIEVTTRTTPACTWRASASTLAVKLVSGTDRIWSSQDCPTVMPEDDLIVRKERPAVVTVTWRGQRSYDGCSRTMPWALPGWYHVQAAAFGSEPTDSQFELRLPVPVTITPKPEPEPTSEPGDQSTRRPGDRPSSSGSRGPSAKPEASPTGRRG